MNKITLSQIRKLQREYGFDSIQKRIDDGSIWKFEGSIGRSAMNLLEQGVCILPTERTNDYYGNTIPSRYDIKSNTKGSFSNAQNFWQSVLDGETMLKPIEENYL